MPSPDLILNLGGQPQTMPTYESQQVPSAWIPVASAISTDVPKQTPTISAILDAREATYGTFQLNSEVAQSLKDIVAKSPGWLAPWEKSLTPSMKEALHQILSKVSRIVCTDGKHKDSWDDIAGYATLISKELHGA